MSTDTTTAPAKPEGYCLDQSDERYWHEQRGAQAEDAALLADLNKLAVLKAEVDFARARHDPGAGKADGILDLCGKIDAQQGRLLKHTPVGFHAASGLLDVVAVQLSERAVYDDSAMDPSVCFGLVANVIRALRMCDGWLNWSDRSALGGQSTDAPSTDPDVARLDTA